MVRVGRQETWYALTGLGYYMPDFSIDADDLDVSVDAEDTIDLQFGGGLDYALRNCPEFFVDARMVIVDIDATVKVEDYYYSEEADTGGSYNHLLFSLGANYTF